MSQRRPHRLGVEPREYLQGPRVVVGGLLVGQHLRRLLAGLQGIADRQLGVLGLGGEREMMGQRAEVLGRARPPPAPSPPGDAAGPGAGPTSPRTESRGSACARTSSDRDPPAPRPPGRRRAPRRGRTGNDPPPCRAPAPAAIRRSRGRSPRPRAAIRWRRLSSRCSRREITSRTSSGSPKRCRSRAPAVCGCTPESARWRTISSMKNGLPSVSRYRASRELARRGTSGPQGDQLDRIRLRQPADVHLAHQAVSAQAGQRGLEALAPALGGAVGAQDQDPARQRRPGQMTQQQERGAVGPLHVVEHDQDGHRRRHISRAARPRPRTAGSAPSRGCRHQSRGRSGSRRRSSGSRRASSTPCSRAVVRSSSVGALAHVVAQRLDERLERDQRLLGRPAGQNQRATGVRARRRSRPAAGSCPRPGRPAAAAPARAAPRESGPASSGPPSHRSSWASSPVAADQTAPAPGRAVRRQLDRPGRPRARHGSTVQPRRVPPPGFSRR